MNASPSNVATTRDEQACSSVASAVAAEPLASIQPVSITTIVGEVSSGSGSWRTYSPVIGAPPACSSPARDDLGRRRGRAVDLRDERGQLRLAPLAERPADVAGVDAFEDAGQLPERER